MKKVNKALAVVLALVFMCMTALTGCSKSSSGIEGTYKLKYGKVNGI